MEQDKSKGSKVALRAIYRLYGGENLKGRPAYYSKMTSLASFLRAAQKASCEVTILADGPIPDDLRRLAEQHGPVIDLPNGPVGMRTSFLSALKLPIELGWPDDDLVYLCEDDYLHTPDALISLRHAAESIPKAAYFALYASTPEFPLQKDDPADSPYRWTPRPRVNVRGQVWENVPSATSTFGVRVRALRSDLSIFRQGMYPYPTRYLDHEICLVYQGSFPYWPKELVMGPMNTRFRTGWRLAAANAILTPFRVAFQIRALTRRRHPHLLYAPSPNLACHMESEFAATGTDWAEQAAAAERWLAESAEPRP